MEDEQKLKLLRLSVDNASNFDEAKAYASFIFGFKEPFETRTPPDDKEDGCKHEYIEPIEDGVYIVAKGLPPVPFGAVGVGQNLENFDVMVRYHGHEWIVAKNNASEGEIHLLKNDALVEKSSPFYKREIEALNDLDMKSCTEHLQKAGIAFELDADLYIPTAGQLAAMYLYREDLNEALKLVRGTPMKEDVYWSSSENSANSSWGVNFYSGNVYGYNKYYSYYVRPCTAFDLKSDMT